MTNKVLKLQKMFRDLFLIEDELDRTERRAKLRGSDNEFFVKMIKTQNDMYDKQYEEIEKTIASWIDVTPDSEYKCVAREYHTGEWYGFNEVVNTDEGLKAVTPALLSEKKETKLSESEKGLLAELHSEGFDYIVTEDNKRYVFNSVSQEVRRVPLLDLVDIKQTRANIEELLRNE